MDRRLPLRVRIALLATVAALAVCISGTASAAPTELFFSEYIEGSSNNKALEIFNGTGAAVTLTGAYDVQIFANGSPTPTATIPLTGSIPNGDVFVLARSTAVAAVLTVTDQTTTNFLFNGNDAVALRNGGSIVDVIGQIGTDPGVEWGSGGTSTLDTTLRRKSAVQSGDPNGADPFDPAVAWDGLPIDTFDGLGSHSLSGGGGGGGGGGGTNSAPQANADSASVDEDATPTTIPVLVNDTDPDGDALSVTAVSDPSHGMATVSGNVTYQPDVDFVGADSFTYTVSDGHGGSATGSVNIAVNSVNDDPDPDDDAATTSEDSPLVVAVLDNDLDVDGDSLVIVVAEGADNGTTTVSVDGHSVIYSPDANFNGSDTFEYTVSDGHDGTDSAEVVVTVTSVNDPPTAQDDAITTGSGESVVVNVLANDSAGPADESSQTLLVSSVGSPSHGSATVITSGTDAGKVRYTPVAGFSGADSFTYVVSDGSSTASGTVSVTVAQQSFRTLCGLTPTILGTLGNDVITGTSGDDVIRARRGNDVIDGNGGNDIICGGPGADRITTGSGEDRSAGGTGDDSIDSGAGDDRVRGGFGRDTILTKAGADSIAAGPGNDSIDAGDGDNRLAGGEGDDSLTAGSGNDRVDGGPGTDACDPDGGRNSVARCES